MINFHFCLTTLLLLCGILIFSANNPIYSVLFLILCFFISSILLIMFKIEFLGLLFIMIYVGAIAVLFLFVIMMINTKGLINKYKKKDFLLNIFLLIVLFIIVNELKNFFTVYSYETIKIFSILNQDLLLFDILNNMNVMGQVIYNYYNIELLVAGLILLIALIGSICLTLDFNGNQSSLKQLSRSSINSKTFFGDSL